MSLPIDPAVPPEHVDLDAFTLAYLQVHEAECPACGYNVHRLVEPRCPECGRRLAVQVVMAEGGFRVAWVVTLIAWGAAAGVGLLLLAVTLREGIPRESSIAFVVWYFMCNIPLPPLLILLRRWFNRLPTWVQWAMGVMACLLTTGMIGWFIPLIER